MCGQTLLFIVIANCTIEAAECERHWEQEKPKGCPDADIISALVRRTILDDYCVFLRAPDLCHAAGQPKPLTTGQDTATNRLSFSSDIYGIDIQRPWLIFNPFTVGWVTGRASGLWKNLASAIAKGSPLRDLQRTRPKLEWFRESQLVEWKPNMAVVVSVNI